MTDEEHGQAEIAAELEQEIDDLALDAGWQHEVAVVSPISGIPSLVAAVGLGMRKRFGYTLEMVL